MNVEDRAKLEQINRAIEILQTHGPHGLCASALGILIVAKYKILDKEAEQYAEDNESETLC